MGEKMRASLFLVCSLFALAPAAQASFVVNFVQVGPNVVATGTGSINTTALSFSGSDVGPALVSDFPSGEVTGPTTLQNVIPWVGVTGPNVFTTGGSLIFADLGSGDTVGLETTLLPSVFPNAIELETTYVSGAPLSSSATWQNATFASLGLIPGSYTWTWGSGSTADFYTLNIGSVPEPSSLALLIGSLLAMGIAVGRKRTSAMPR